MPKPFFWKNSSNAIQSIVIIMSCRWPSLTTSPYRSSPPAGLQGYILNPDIAAVCMFELVVLLLPDHMWGSIGVHHLWACYCFSSSVLRVWIVMVFLMGGRWPHSWFLVECCHQDLFNIALNRVHAFLNGICL